jgi:hypothetical protein
MHSMVLPGLFAFDSMPALLRRFAFGFRAYVMFLLILFVLALQGLLGLGGNDRLAHDLRRFARRPLGMVG